MSQYSRKATNQVEDVFNAFSPHVDFHISFNQRAFAFVPKWFNASDGNMVSRYATHVLQPSNEIGPVYHNASTLPISHVCPESLSVRFAWAIFPELKTF